MPNEFGGTAPRIAIERTDSLPAGVPVKLTVAVVEKSPTDVPPQIRVTLRSEADGTRTYLTTGKHVFGGVESVSDGPQLLLLPVGFDIRHTNYRPTTDELVFDTNLARNTLAPGEQDEVTYAVWDHPSNAGDPYATGTYRFEDSYELEEGGASFVWGFDLRVSR